MTIYFIGAGPGDPELITLKAQRLLQRLRVVVYAGSLVPWALLQWCPLDASLHDSSSLERTQIIDLLENAHHRGMDAGRLHSGDPALYGAIQEQIRELDRRGIPWEIIPGVSAFSAAAAALGVEYTQPGVSQTLVLTRQAGRTPVPETEDLENLARARSSLCLFLSTGRAREATEKLMAHYAPETPAAVVYRVSQPEQQLHRCQLQHLPEKVEELPRRATALLLVGEFLRGQGEDSRLYDPAFSHGFRQSSQLGEGER